MVKMEERLCRAYDLLRRLGGTANYKGFSYAAYAIALCAERPELLLLVTKDLYPAVAKQYQTTWKAVERDIRTLVAMIWAQNSAMLGRIAGSPLEKRPRSAKFIASTAADLQCSEMGKFFEHTG